MLKGMEVRDDLYVLPLVFPIVHSTQSTREEIGFEILESLSTLNPKP